MTRKTQIAFGAHSQAFSGVAGSRPKADQSEKAGDGPEGGLSDAPSPDRSGRPLPHPTALSHSTAFAAGVPSLPTTLQVAKSP